MRLSLGLFLLIGAISIPRSIFACAVCEGKVPITFYGDFCASGSYSVVLTDPAGDTKTVSGSSTGCAYGMTSVDALNVKPGQTLTLKVPAAQYNSLHINLKVEGCFKVKVNDVEQTDINEVLSGPCTSTQSEKTWTIVVVPASDNGGPGTSGDSDSSLSSVHWQASMGGLSNGESAGSLMLSEGAITSSSYTPNALLYSAPSSEVEVIRNLGVLRQVKSPESLADIVAINSSQYEIRYYLASNSGSKTSGVYVPIGSPFVKYTIENPGGSAPNPLRITETRGSVAVASDFSYNSTTGDWTYNKGGLRLESLTTMNLANGDKKVTRVISDPATSVIALKTVTTKHMFPWGMEVIQKIEDPDGSPVTTDYVFYENIADGGAYRHLKSFSRSDGYWEFYEYSSSSVSFGNLVTTYRPGKDSPTSPQANTQNKTAFTYYAHAVSEIGGYSRFLTVPNAEIITAFGQSMGSTNELYSDSVLIGGQPGERVHRWKSDVVRAHTHLIRYTSSAVAPYTSQISSEQYIDGRKDTYSYELGNYSGGTFTPGSGKFFRKMVVHGTKDFPNGIDGRTTREITIRNPAGSLLEEETQIYSGGSYVSATKTLHGYNLDGRLTSSAKDGRVIYEANWIGNRKQWEKDEEGIQTSFILYDVLDRIKTQSRMGVTTTITYDAIDRVRNTTRASGALSLSSSTGYDPAGRVSSEISEEGLTTNTTYSNGGRTVTRTLPSLATEITDHYADGSLKSVTGTGVVAKFYDYGADANGLWTKESISAASSPRWTKSYENIFGEIIRREYPGYTGTTLTNILNVDKRGLLISQTIPGEVPKLFEYDELGVLKRQGRDVNGNGSLDLASTDEVTEFNFGFENDAVLGGWYEVRGTSRYEGAAGISTRIFTEKNLFSGGGTTTLDRTVKIDRYQKTTTTTSVVSRSTQTVTATTIASDSTIAAVATTIGGRLMSENTNTVAQPTVYQYDGLGRVDLITDPRGVVTDPVYSGALLSSVSVAGQPTGFTFYPNGQLGAGQLFTTTYADGKTEIRAYDLRGFLTGISGTGVYKWTQTIDSYGDRTELYTYRQGSSGDSTTWIFDAPTGLLTKKQDANVHPTDYEYKADNHLLLRKSPRGINTTYSFDGRGNLANTDYSDSTRDVKVEYDRVNRPNKVFDAAGVHILNYSLGEESEKITLGPLAGLRNSRQFDAVGRLSGITAQTDIWNQSVKYQYDTVSRLNFVKMNSNTATYGYLTNSDLLETTTFSGGMTSTRQWDGANRLKKISHTVGAETRSFDTTLFDNRNRRKEVAWEDGSKWFIGYDPLGQVTSGVRKWMDSTPTEVEGQKYGYAYDGIGNREGPLGATLNGRNASYSASNLNQITTRSVPAAVDVMGNAASNATVTVNGQATSRKNGYFYKLLTDAGVLYPVNIAQNITATTASGTTSRIVNTVVSRPPEYLSYDDDGNLSYDQLWTYSWDGENRLQSLESRSYVPDPQKRKLVFSYDWLGRRVEKFVYQWTNSEWLLHDHTRSIWSGWSLQAEVGDSGQSIRAYTWGLDISGSLGGAGGVGGLLFERNFYANKTLVAGSDLNGNLVRLTDVASGQNAASYEYGPFGEVIRASGDYATLNPFGFSSKYTDWETGLIYYGYRYYSSNLGRWISRDPLGEAESLNLNTLAGNDLINRWDFLGMAQSKPGPTRPPKKNGKDDFVDHYYNGHGKPFDLFSRGYGPTLEKALQEHIEQNLKAKIEEIIVSEWSSRGLSPGASFTTNITRASQRGRLITRPDLQESIFSVGNTTLVSNLDGLLSVQCSSLLSAIKYTFKGTRFHSIDDDFSDPLSFDQWTHGLWPGTGDFFGGTPYQITADWNRKFNLNSKF